MRKTNPRRMSTSRKLMLLLLSMLFCFLLASNALLYMSANRLNEETANSMRTRYGVAVDRLADHFFRVRSLLQGLLDDADLNSLTRLAESGDNQQRVSAIARVQSKLTLIKNSSGLLKNVSVYLPKERMALNADGSVKGSIVRYDEREDARLRAKYGEWSHLLEMDEGRVTMPVKSSSGLRGTLYSVMLAEFSDEAVLSELAGAMDADGETYYMLDIQNGAYTLASKMHEGAAAFMRGAAGKNQTRAATWRGVEYLITLISREDSGLGLYAMLPSAAKLYGIRAQNTLATVLIVAVVALGALYIFMDYKLVDQPLRQLIDAFSSVEHDDLNIRIDTSLNNEFGRLFGHFNDMAAHLQSLIDVTLKQERLLLRAELKHLQEQTNPHFLYNSYFLLHRMIKGNDNERAARLSAELGKYLKYITRRGQDFVPFSDEYEHALMYTKIQAERFTGRIDVQFGDMPPEAADIRTPRLILQPLIENSFLHGLENKVSGGILKIDVDLTGADLTLTVQDNGGELNEQALEGLAERVLHPPENEITALTNIARRLQLLYGGGQRIFVARSPLGGLRVTLLIPRQTGGTV